MCGEHDELSAQRRQRQRFASALGRPGLELLALLAATAGAFGDTDRALGTLAARLHQPSPA